MGLLDRLKRVATRSAAPAKLTDGSHLVTVTVYGDAVSGWSASTLEASCEAAGPKLDGVVPSLLQCLRSALEGLGDTTLQFVWWIGAENAPDNVVVDVAGTEVGEYGTTSTDARFTSAVHSDSLDVLTKEISVLRDRLGSEETMVTMVFSRREHL